jgi:hypothetical protein
VLPDFLVIGAQRGGTTLLHALMQAHPQIYVPSERKEIHYFDRFFDRGEDWYRSYFPSSAIGPSVRTVGEVTPDYLGTAVAAARIHTLLPGVRLVAILRNPIERALSAYEYARRSRNERRPLSTYLRDDRTVLEWGLYGRHLQRYLDVFPRQSLHVLLLEDLVASPRKELEGLGGFLGVEPDWTLSLLATPMNVSAVPRFRAGFAFARRVGQWLASHDVNWPARWAKAMGVPRLFGHGRQPAPIKDDVRHELAAFYRDDVRTLGRLLGRDLSGWHI